MTPSRDQLLKQCLFHGERLVLSDSLYEEAVQTLTDSLLRQDSANRDLTTKLFDLGSRRGRAEIYAKEPGVAAGLAEAAWLYGRYGVRAQLHKNDGDVIQPGEQVLSVVGDAEHVLALERLGLNLLQRMSGVATMTRQMQAQVRAISSSACVVATRKTAWGLLDKRAVHLGGGGTHRLGLDDAILLKNNHLALLGPREEESARLAIERAWESRQLAAFIEIEVRTLAGALAAARTFRKLLGSAGASYPCVVMLDNWAPQAIAPLVAELCEQRLWEFVLLEASGGINESNLRAYAESGVDAISVGALTHSSRALDISQKLFLEEGTQNADRTRAVRGAVRPSAN
ncbi:MAG: carboxylating nicotinate-nucleotide diphosphorylase [Candidatus Acidiferrales bacterium]